MSLYPLYYEKPKMLIIVYKFSTQNITLTEEICNRRDHEHK